VIQVNVCHGWGCVSMTRCAISDFNHERKPGTWTRHFQPERTGDACEYFEPLHQERPWGVGKVVED
jgi:hypothetical protein